MSLKIKFLVVFLIVSIIPVSIITVYTYGRYTKLVNEQMSLVTKTYINNISKDTSDKVDKIDRMTDVFQMYTQGSYSILDDIRKYREKGNYSSYDLYKTRNNMKFICQDLIYQNDFVNGIFIFTPSGENIGYGYGNDIDIKLGYTPFKDKWYKDTLKLGGDIYISDVSTKNFIINSQPSISFSRAIYDVSSRQFLGVLLIDCSPQIFMTANTGNLMNTISVYIEKDNGKVLYSNQSTDRPPYLKGTDSGNYKIQTLHSNWLPIKTVVYMNYAKLYNQFGITRNTIIYIFLLCIFIFVMLSIVFSFTLTKPILYLRNIMGQRNPHTLVTNESYLNRNDEIGVLFNEYNNMIEEINAYIREKYQNKLITLDSQMKALEAQINPHFLYNTLETMNSIAEIEGVESISVMSLSLGNMFRYAIKTNGELVTVEQEINHLKDYLSIEKIRYGDKLNYDISIPSEIYGIRILKLILQPIVENSIKHGFSAVSNSVNILISGKLQDNLICLYITDDGLGISADRVSEIIDMLSNPPEFNELGQRSKSSIGLKNIHSRIQLYYGTEYGLSIQSREGHGTTIGITVPIIDKGA